MEPRKRNFPHTRKEWEEKIRPIFTVLYHQWDHKLSDIVETMKGYGFRAEYVYLCQEPSRICLTWLQGTPLQNVHQKMGPQQEEQGTRWLRVAVVC